MISSIPLTLSRDASGALDDVVCTEAHVTLERMSKTCWGLVVTDAKSGTRVYINLMSKAEIKTVIETAIETEVVEERE